jgi:hypothetical protein
MTTKCAVCHKRSSKGEHQCIVCNNIYSNVNDLIAHHTARQHIGGHYPSEGPLVTKRRRRSGVDEAEEALDVPDLGGDDDVDPEVEQNDEDVVNDDDTIALPPPTLTKSSTKRKGLCRFLWRFFFSFVLGFVSFAFVYMCWPC